MKVKNIIEYNITMLDNKYLNQRVYVLYIA